jgi:D-alanine-D-alanine ligase
VTTTILFGGLSRERLVSVASAQGLALALPDADLWFWDVDGVHAATRPALAAHTKPFEEAFVADGARLGAIDAALDRAAQEKRILILAMHGGEAENGELQAMCEARGLAYTGSGPAASHLAFDKIAAKRFAACAGLRTAQTIALSELESALAEHGKLVAKPAEDGSSYGLIFVNANQDCAAVRQAAKTEKYLVEAFVTGPEGTCGVLEKEDGALIALPPVEIVPADGAFDYTAKYLAKATEEICPGRFAPALTEEIKHMAITAHRALNCRGYSRTDFIVGPHGPVYIETNTLPGLTKSSLYPKALAAEGIAFTDFLNGQIALAKARRG